MTTPIRIQSRRTARYNMQDTSRAANGLPAKKVTRPSKYGNPWRIEDYLDAGYKATRLQAARICVDAHRAWLKGEKHWAHGSSVPPVPDLEPLRGFNLACSCPPNQPCHADNYLAILYPCSK